VADPREVHQIEYRWHPVRDLCPIASSMSPDSTRGWDSRIRAWVRHPSAEAPVESVCYQLLPPNGSLAALAFRYRMQGGGDAGTGGRPLVSRVLAGNASLLTPEVAIALCRTGLPALAGERPGQVTAGDELLSVSADDLVALAAERAGDLDDEAAWTDGLAQVVAVALADPGTPLAVTVAGPRIGGLAGELAPLLWGLCRIVRPLLGTVRRGWSFSTFELPLGSVDPKVLPDIVFRGAAEAHSAPPATPRREARVFLGHPGGAGSGGLREPGLSQHGALAGTAQAWLADWLVAEYRAGGSDAIAGLIAGCAVEQPLHARLGAIYDVLHAKWAAKAIEPPRSPGQAPGPRISADEAAPRTEAARAVEGSPGAAISAAEASLRAEAARAVEAGPGAEADSDGDPGWAAEADLGGDPGRAAQAARALDASLGAEAGAGADAGWVPAAGPAADAAWVPAAGADTDPDWETSGEADAGWAPVPPPGEPDDYEPPARRAPARPYPEPGALGSYRREGMPPPLPPRQQGPRESALRAASREQGSRDEGLPGQGLPGQGLPGQGLPGQGLPGQGLPGQGLPGYPSEPGQGLPAKGTPGPATREPGRPGPGPQPSTMPQLLARLAGTQDADEFKSILQDVLTVSGVPEFGERVEARRLLAEVSWCIHPSRPGARELHADELSRIFQLIIIPDLDRPRVAREIADWAAIAPPAVIRGLLGGAKAGGRSPGGDRYPVMMKILEPVLADRWIDEHDLQADWDPRRSGRVRQEPGFRALRPFRRRP
jgi:hypothetical protein